MSIDAHADSPETGEWTILPQEPGRWSSLLPNSRRKVAIWALVMESQGVPCRIERYGVGWQLLVPRDRLDFATQQLCCYESENTGWPPPPPRPNPLVGNTLTTISVLLLLATFHNMTRINLVVVGHSAPDWLHAGSAQAARILDGEWWRLVTALTLHSNWLHLTSNLAIGGIFIIFLCKELGSGLAWTLLIATGMLGNLANAHFHLPTHTSVGSSTLIFGGVGLLSAISMIRYRHHLKRRWYAPAGGALALLASLGTEGVNTDLGAHFFGFIFGFMIGTVIEHVTEKHGRPGKILNSLLVCISAIIVVLAWWLALTSG